jgi:hypothetical protein
MDGIGELIQSIDLIASVDAEVTDEDLHDGLVALRHQSARLRAEEIRLTGMYDLRRGYAADGSKSAAARLARDAKCSLQAMRHQVYLSKRSRLMPRVAEAFAAGTISEDHVRVFARVAGSHRPAVKAAFPDAEKLLLDKAHDLEFAEFVAAVRYGEQLVDEDGAEDKASNDYAARRLNVSDMLDGVKRIDGQMDPIGGEIFASELERLETALFRADWAEAKEAWGNQTTIEKLKRTSGQRRHDALVEMATRSATIPKDGRRPSPLFTVLVGWETFKGRICKLASGQTVTPGQAAPWLFDAEIERVVFDTPNRVIEVGKRDRFFRGGLRRAIQVRDQHCTHPGCDIPYPHCAVDHAQPFGEGGETIQSNGRLRCRHHNPPDNGWTPQPEPDDHDDDEDDDDDEDPEPDDTG